jgi:two-component system NtrC family sensor kinase
LLIYHLILAVATLVSAASAGFIYAQSPERRASQLFALLMLSAAWWSGCEFAWNMAADDVEARFWMKMAAAGWLSLGAIVPHLVFQSLDNSSRAALRPWRRLQGWVAASVYAVAAVMLVLAWTTTFVIGEVRPAPWGWALDLGPGFYVNYAFTTAGVGVSCFVISRATSRASMAETLQMPWTWLAIGAPTVIIFSTDVLLPALSIELPRLGSSSMAVTGLVVAWTVLHYGLSMISPPRFGDEILETLEDGVALVNADGTIRRANLALSRLCGCSVDELVGLPMSEVLDRDVRAHSEIDDMHREVLRKDGERVPVSVSVGVLRERQQNELGVVVVLRDQREMEELRRSSLTHARLAAVGELAAGLAHEINNPVAFVGSNLRLLRDHWKQVTLEDSDALGHEEREVLVAEGGDLIKESLEGVERAAEIVRGVKNFTHAGGMERTLASLGDLIVGCLPMVRPQLPPGVEILIDFAEVPAVPCAPQELKQVFLNLLINAGHAVGLGGTIRIATAVDGDLAVVSVSDDGHGIETEVIDRIFDPFFTTKPVGEGTGLGLGIAHQVVTQHGGVITVNSEPEAGTTFRVYLPLHVAE